MRFSSPVMPCPFCGSKTLTLVQLDQHEWVIECLDCSATGPIMENKNDAWEGWGNRGNEPVTKQFPGTANGVA